jgi:hypothetical protein
MLRPTPLPDRAAPLHGAPRNPLPVVALAVGAALAALARNGTQVSGPAHGSRAGAFAWLAVQFLAVLAVLLPLAWYVRGTGRTSQLRLHVDVGDAPVRIRWPRRLVGARAADDEGWGRTAWMPGDDEPWSPERDRGNPRPR